MDATAEELKQEATHRYKKAVLRLNKLGLIEFCDGHPGIEITEAGLNALQQIIDNIDGGGS